MNLELLKFGYLLALACAILLNAFVDWRWRLVWWQDAGRALITTIVGWLVFVCWDQLLLTLGIIWAGESVFMTGWQVWPGMPVEELVFLWFLGYQALILWEGARRWQGR